MNKQNSRYLKSVCYIALFLIIYLLSFNPFFSLKIGNAVPVMAIAAVITVAFYFGEWWGFTAGIISGIFADAVTSGAFCFNAVAFMLAGLLTGVLLRKYLNNNIFSALALSGIANGIYFFLNGIFFVSKSGALQGFEYLLLHSLPSAVYSALFILPFYYLGKLINKI